MKRLAAILLSLVFLVGCGEGYHREWHPYYPGDCERCEREHEHRERRERREERREHHEHHHHDRDDR